MQIIRHRFSLQFRKAWPWFLLLFVLVDFALAFLQFYCTPLDGDLAGIVLPSEHYSRVLQDPFGFSVLLHGEKYAAPNRFFVHGFMLVYFKQVPALFQYFTSPVNSIYLACAVLKITIHLLISGLLAGFISGKTNPFRKDFLLSMALIVPLFQNTAYQGIMGIIQQSITYTCFYALPLSLLLLFFFLLQKGMQVNGTFYLPFFKKILLAILSIILAFSGPLVAPVVIIITAMVFFYYWKTPQTALANNSYIKQLKTSFQRIPGPLLFLAVLCLYTLYLGTYNLEGNLTVPLLERYVRLPQGLINQLSIRLGLPLLLFLLLLNTIILKKQKEQQDALYVLNILKGLALFSIIFILLLPLGGYREYRHNIIRGDTILPILIGLIYGFSLSTFYLIRLLTARYLRIYVTTIMLFLAVFVNADWLDTSLNHCEKAALEKIARSPDVVVRVDDGCNVMAWEKITDYRNSELNCRLLQYWGVTKRVKYYYQE